MTGFSVKYKANLNLARPDPINQFAKYLHYVRVICLCILKCFMSTISMHCKLRVFSRWFCYFYSTLDCGTTHIQASVLPQKYSIRVHGTDQGNRLQASPNFC